MARKPQAHPSVRAAAQTSAAQLAANRANAQSSTGPRTAEGKARVSQNAVKHGLFSQNLDLIWTQLGQTQERAAHNAYLTRLWEEHRPRTFEEEEIVDLLAASWCRLQWVHGRMEAYRMGDRSPAEIVIGTAAIAKEVSRLTRDMSRLRRDLEFLQRWRDRRGARDEAAPGSRATPSSPLRPAVPSQTMDDPTVAAAPTSAAGNGTAPSEQGEVDAELADAALAPEKVVEAAPAGAAPTPPYPTTTKMTPHGLVRTQIRDGITYTSVDPL